MAKANIATVNEVGARMIVANCPHCFDTIKNEYPELGGHYEVLHHSELLVDLRRCEDISDTQISVKFNDVNPFRILQYFELIATWALL